MSTTSTARGPVPLVIGLDLSLTSTGVAGPDWADALRPKTGMRGHARLDWHLEAITDRVRRADLVVVEGAAYGHGAQAGHHELAGLWWMVTQELWRRHIPYAQVPPVQRTIYACGVANPAKEHPKTVRARVAKGMVRDAVAERYGLECDGAGRYDKADACILAHMGRDWLGHPVVDLPEQYRRALAGVSWPAPLGAGSVKANLVENKGN
ncbi:hypothetical protein F4556_005083 [Kitasatospora gansuensis]|uniref:RuvC-like resolvase n=1 Tax=Kitasatospora gansuensis TaxID=258050 RepID=A0A7W7SFJ5_9ACTN|nr:hypothetical protein [Kitasatospora gansuensis]MBB4949548.1 hypothetical protein [Kitasatospora gansuensis]